MTRISALAYCGAATIQTKPEKILKVVCNHYGIKLDAIKGESRKGNIVEAKKISAFLLYRYCKNGKSLKSIANILGYDSEGSHATILHHYNDVVKKCETYALWREKLALIENLCFAYIKGLKENSSKTILDAKNDPEILNKYK